MTKTGAVTFSILAFVIFGYASAHAEEMSPLQQINFGISAQDVKCKEGLILVIKSENDHPACVRPSSEQRLLEHGWIVPMVSNSSSSTNENTSKVSTNAENKIENSDNNVSSESKTATIHDNMTLTTSTDNINQTNIQNSTTNANNSGNDTITYDMVYRWYEENYHATPSPDNKLAGGYAPLSALNVTPTASSNIPNEVKILFIGMSPSTLKVGDMPKFTVTWQNISDKPIYVRDGTIISPVGTSITPTENVLMGYAGSNGITPSEGSFMVNSNQIYTSNAAIDMSYGKMDLHSFKYSGFDYGTFLIQKPGPLHVTMTLFLRNHGEQDQFDIMDKIQFDVNATQ